MKAMYRPAKPSSKYARDMRQHIRNDVDRYLDAREQTIMDRICAFTVIVLNSEFGFGPKRARRFWKALSAETDRRARDIADDAGNDLLFEHLERIGFAELALRIQDDYAAERAAVRDSVFDTGEDDGG